MSATCGHMDRLTATGLREDSWAEVVRVHQKLNQVESTRRTAQMQTGHPIFADCLQIAATVQQSLKNI